MHVKVRLTYLHAAPHRLHLSGQGFYHAGGEAGGEGLPAADWRSDQDRDPDQTRIQIRLEAFNVLNTAN